VIKNIFIFTIGTVVNKGINFFILPILTYYLTKDDYGMVGVINSVLVIAGIYVGFFPNNFIMVKFHKLKKELMSRYIFNIFILIFVSFIFLAIFLYFLSPFIFPYYEKAHQLTILILFLALFQVLWRMWSVLTEIEQKAYKFVIAQFFQVLLIVGLTLFLVIKLSLGWEGKFYAEFFIYLLFSIYVIFSLYKRGFITVDFDLKKVKEVFAFTFPLTFYVLGLFAMGTIDKIFVANMLDLQSAGIYSIAITLSIILNIGFDGVLKAWLPNMFKLLNSSDKNDYKKVIYGNYIYSALVVFGVVVYIFLSPYVFDLMIDKKFSPALDILPILIVAYGFEGLRKPVTELLNHIDRVNIVAVITIFSALLNVILNIFWIKSMGIKGAAFATMISFVVLYLLTLASVYYFYKMRKDEKLF